MRFLYFSWFIEEKKRIIKSQKRISNGIQFECSLCVRIEQGSEGKPAGPIKSNSSIADEWTQHHNGYGLKERQRRRFNKLAV